jgi:soluble lytic murein transglycosylase-like protein
MSTQMLVGPAGGGPADVVAATQRVQQLQTLITRVGHQDAPSALSAPSTPSGSFAATLASASGSTGGYPTSTANLASASQVADPRLTSAGYAPAGATVSTGSGGAGAYDQLIEQAAGRYGLDPAILHGLIQQESGFNPSSHSSAGALGLTQLMPGTAASLGVSNPLDPAQSIDGGARYLSRLLGQFGGNTVDALAAYNAGPGAVQRYGGVPPYAETQSYVSKVLGYAAAYRQAPSGATTGATT